MKKRESRGPVGNRFRSYRNDFGLVAKRDPVGVIRAKLFVLTNESRPIFHGNLACLFSSSQIERKALRVIGQQICNF